MVITKKKPSKTVKSTNNPVTLSSREICKIMRECRANGVSSLSIEGLQLSLVDIFVDRKPKPVPFPKPVEAPQPQELPIAAELETDKHDQELASLMITDPLAYEELMTMSDIK